MSADLPLEEPPRRMTERIAGTHGAKSSYTWDRSFRLGRIVVRAARPPWVSRSARHPGWPLRLVSVTPPAALVPWYVLVGRPVGADPPDERRALGYLRAVVLFLPSGILVGETRLMAFALVPQCFMALRLRWALAAVTVINIAPVAGWALLWWPSGQDVFFNSLFGVVTLVFSAAFGGTDHPHHRAEPGTGRADRRTGRQSPRALPALVAHGALAERERLSREIHDTLAQGFTSLLMLVQAVEAELEHDVPQARRHLSLMAETARQNLAEARALVAGARPPISTGPRCPTRCAGWPRATRRRSTSPAPCARCPPGRGRGPRSCQEALANARKHAASLRPSRSP